MILAELSLASSETAHLKHKALIVVRLEGILIQGDDLHIKCSQLIHVIMLENSSQFLLVKMVLIGQKMMS